MATLSLRMRDDLKRKAQSLASRQGVSLNNYNNSVVAASVAQEETTRFFNDRLQAVDLVPEIKQSTANANMHWRDFSQIVFPVDHLGWYSTPLSRLVDLSRLIPNWVALPGQSWGRFQDLANKSSNVQWHLA